MGSTAPSGVGDGRLHGGDARTCGRRSLYARRIVRVPRRACQICDGASARWGNQMPISRCGRLGRVRAVHEVLLHGLAPVAAEVAPDRPGAAASGPSAPASARKPSMHAPLDDRGDHRAGGHELHQRLEERLALVLGVVPVQQVAVERCAARAATRRVALGLDPAQHLAGEAAAYAVGLDEDEAALGRGVSVTARASPRVGRRGAGSPYPARDQRPRTASGPPWPGGAPWRLEPRSPPRARPAAQREHPQRHEDRAHDSHQPAPRTRWRRSSTCTTSRAT